MACAVEVRSTAPGSQASATPARARWSATSSPWWSAAKLVASRAGPAQPGQRDRDVGGAAPGVLVQVPALGPHDVDQRLPHDQHTALHARVSTTTGAKMARVRHAPALRGASSKVLGLVALIDLLVGLVLVRGRRRLRPPGARRSPAWSCCSPAAACSPTWPGGGNQPDAPCDRLRPLRRRRRRRRHRRPARTWPATTSPSWPAGEHLARIRADGLVLDTAEGRHAVRGARHRHRGRGRLDRRHRRAAGREVAPDRGRARRPGRPRAADTPVVCVAERRRQRAGHAAPVRPHLRDHGDAALPAPRAGRRGPGLPPGARHPRRRPLPLRHRRA